ncbi:MAG: antibiotic biosynthesis monooxygenase family protein [Pseudomonadota bacterium]
MQALLFEMEPRDGHEEHYFRHAARLRPILMQHDGLIYIERFKSLANPKVILSHSLWRDEAAIARWRTNSEHHRSQSAGRFKHFQDYRIRISHVLRYADSDAPVQEWSREGSYSTPNLRTGRFIVILRSRKELIKADGETFTSVTETNSYLTVLEVVSQANGQSKIDEAHSDGSVSTAVLASVSRDYGMYERAEAPQYFKTFE